MTEVHKSSRWMTQATPQVLFYFTFVPIGKSSVIKIVCQVLPSTSKIPGNHFRVFHSLQMEERVEECLAGWGWSGPASQSASHLTFVLRDPLLFQWHGESLSSHTAVSCPTATVAGGEYIHSHSWLNVCAQVYPLFQAGRCYKRCFVVLYIVHKHLHSRRRV